MHVSRPPTPPPVLVCSGALGRCGGGSGRASCAVPAAQPQLAFPGPLPFSWAAVGSVRGGPPRQGRACQRPRCGLGAASGRGDSPRSPPGTLGAPSAPHLPALSLAAPPYLVSRERRAWGGWEAGLARQWSGALAVRPPSLDAVAGAGSTGPVCCRSSWEVVKFGPCVVILEDPWLACTCLHACTPGPCPRGRPPRSPLQRPVLRVLKTNQRWGRCPQATGLGRAPWTQSPCGASWLTARPAPAVWPH